LNSIQRLDALREDLVLFIAVSEASVLAHPKGEDGA
jgi:hypothetical protein